MTPWPSPSLRANDNKFGWTRRPLALPARYRTALNRISVSTPVLTQGFARRLWYYIETMVSEVFRASRDRFLIEKLAAAMERGLDPGAADRLGTYLELVATWNRRLNLTAARGPSEQAEVLLADAIVLGDFALVPKGARLVDVGSGAGAPAIPLLLLRSDITAVLVEPKQKRVAFLNTAIGTLELMDRAQVFRGRIDPQSPHVQGERFDVAISRATFAPEVWLATGLSLARRTLLLTASTEPPAAPPQVECIYAYEYRLPGSGAPRRISVYVDCTRIG
jgi:16S rRNA (guanine527-N7)-methyltransferase